MRPEDQYLQALLAQPAVSTITLADGSSVRVEDVYLPRTLLHEVKQKESERKSGEPEREITVKLPVELWPKLDQERVVVVEGPAGIGKSTLTKQLVRESRGHYPIPIWIAFRAFVASGLSLADYLDQHYVPWLGLAGLRVPYHADGTGPDRSVGQWLYEQWKDGFGGLLILDGLDEVFRHEERVAALQGLPITRTGATRPATILTSRPLSQSLLPQMAKVEVQGLTPPEQIKFIEGYQASLQLTKDQVSHFTNATKKQEQGRLRELLTRPGHLIQILTTYARTNTLLDTETAVVDELLKSRLTITGRSEPPLEPDEPEKKHIVLASLALHFLACRQGQRHTRAQLLALIQQVLGEHTTHGTSLFPLSQATALLNDLTRNSALLTEVEPEVYVFETVIWLQHLAGTALANSTIISSLNLSETQVLHFLDKKAWDPEWEPVLKSWAGTTNDPLLFLRKLAYANDDLLARHRLGSAGRLLQEVVPAVREQARYEQLHEHVVTEAFNRWMIEVGRHTESLIELSLRGAWIETVYGQEHLLNELKGSDIVKRETVAKVLGGLGGLMPAKVQQALVAQLVDKDQGVRWTAVGALGQLGPAMSEEVQQALVERLADADGSVRGAAVKALGTLGVAMPTAAQQALVRLLRDNDVFVSEEVPRALGKLGRTMPAVVLQALVERFTDNSLYVIKAGAGPRGTLVAEMPTVVQQALAERLADKDEGVRCRAAEALGQLGPAMPAAWQQALAGALLDENHEVRSAAASALGTLEGSMPDVVQQALVERLTDETPYVRGGAARALGKLGPAMPEVVQQALVERLADKDEGVRYQAAEALGQLGSAMPAAWQQALVGRLTDETPYVRGGAARALGKLGPAMPEVVQQALVKGWTITLEDLVVSSSVLSAHENLVASSCMAYALGSMGAAMPEGVQQTLVGRLTDETPYVRKVVVHALGMLGMSMPTVVQQALVERLADKDQEVRNYAAFALGKLGAAMPLSVQRALFRCGGLGMRALGELGPAMSVVTEWILVGNLSNKDTWVQSEAARALGKLGAAMPESVQLNLQKRLADKESFVRLEAAKALSLGQRGGLRFISEGSRFVSRLSSDLSATVPLGDGCSTTHQKSSPFSLAC